MAKILEIKNSKNKKIIASIELTPKEYRALKGSIENLTVFSGENLEEESRLVQRGKKESTKYFLLPRNLRCGIKPSQEVKCERIDTKNNSLFIFGMGKK